MHRVRDVLTVLAWLACAACGGAAEPGGVTGPTSPKAVAADGGAAATASDGGTKDGRPFAGSTAEATELISSAVDTRQHEIAVCVREFRGRRKASTKVTVSFGIDQEGRVLGVTSKGKEDNEFKECVQGALKNAPFPRSHAGVITVTKSYEDILQ